MHDPRLPAGGAARTPARPQGTPRTPKRAPPAPPPAAPPPKHASTRPFRRHFFDRQDPFESAGIRLEQFTFYGAEFVGPLAPQVATEVNREIARRLTPMHAAGSHGCVLDFDDTEMRGEALRRFAVMSTDTARETRATVNAYVCAYGEYLYYSVRGYVLPPLNLLRAFVGLLVTLAALAPGAYLVYNGSGVGPWLVVGITLIALAHRYLSFVRGMVGGDRIRIALRKQFPDDLNQSTFNMDDVHAFMKTHVSLTADALVAVLHRHGIGAETVKAMVQQVQINNINSGGGNILGAILGGSGHRMSVQRKS